MHVPSRTWQAQLRALTLGGGCDDCRRGDDRRRGRSARARRRAHPRRRDRRHDARVGRAALARGRSRAAQTSASTSFNDSSLNAFVSGGQNIFIHTGLLLAAREPNEIMGVMAHETGHIAGGHLARNRQAIQQAMGTGADLYRPRRPRHRRRRAGRGAALIAGSQAFAHGKFRAPHAGAGIPPPTKPALQYLEESDQSGRGLVGSSTDNLRRYEFQVRRAPPYMLTHPFTSDRVESLRIRVEGAEHRDAVDTPENIRRFQFMQAKLIGFLNTQGQTLSRYPLSDTSAPARYARAVAYYRVSELAKAARGTRRARSATSRAIRTSRN